MNDTRKDIDIITELGGVNSKDHAMTVFRQYLNESQLAKISRIRHPDVLMRIANAIVLCNPDSVFINTGSSEDKQFIRQLALTNKEEAPLAMEGHTLHFDLAEEQGRIMDRTFYIADPSDLVSSLANRMDRPTALEQVRSNLKNIMNGKTLVVGFYMRGPVDLPYPTRPLKSPVPPMSPTVQTCSTGIPLKILKKKLNAWAIFLPMSTAKGKIGLKISPMQECSWIESIRPPTVSNAPTPGTPCS